MTPDAKYFYTAGANNQLKQWNTKDWQLEKDLSDYSIIGRFSFISMDITSDKGKHM